MVHPLAGKKAPDSMLVDVAKLTSSYYQNKPDSAVAEQRVSFGTSGHRGSALRNNFNEEHVAAICQAVCEVRRARKVDGPMFLGRDTHALSEPSEKTAIEVLAANDVALVLPAGGKPSPTPVISQAILDYNRGRSQGLADGIIITPSHNPPEDGGIKYNPPHGGPAEPQITSEIEKLANRFLESGAMRRLPYWQALGSPRVLRRDIHAEYLRGLAQVLDLESIARSDLVLAVDPLGGSSLFVWELIAAQGLKIEIVNSRLDPTFSFIPVDHDGRIRMDCSSPYAMAALMEKRSRYRLACGNDPDADRFGVVTPAGLLNPNRYLAAAAYYLLQQRAVWKPHMMVGKTLVSSTLIDRAVELCGRRVLEVPVGFKWFVDGLYRSALCFAGEESAGATLLRRDGTVWTTDKDGIALCLLAAEITAVTGKDPGQLADELEEKTGRVYYQRRDEPADPRCKQALKKVTAREVKISELAGQPVTRILDRAPGNGEPIGGLKIITDGGWCALRPSGTEDILKIYAESFIGPEHLESIFDQARDIVQRITQSCGR